MSHFRFVTNWEFSAPIDRVWDILVNADRLPEWWPGFRQAVSRGADRTVRVGQKVDCVLRAPLWYSLRFTLEVADVTPQVLLKLRSSGDLVGSGQWDLRPNGSGTAVTYTWDIRLTRPVMAWLSGLLPARAVLSRNHEVVMAQGYRNLRGLLEQPP